MNFLLILSAMLSAVTGAFSGVRAPEARPHHMAMARAEAPCPQHMVQTARLTPSAPADSPRIAPRFTLAAFDLPRSIPAYADRLIE